MQETLEQLQEKLKQVIARVERIEQQTGKTTLLIADVAALTGMSKSHIYKLTCTNQIPHYKPNGKHLYFDRAEVEAWMKRGRVQTNAEAQQVATMYNVRKAMGV